jgi:HD-GYP domain-containing protein (c-di-GMP phosphodiesterase class II)
MKEMRAAIHSGVSGQFQSFVLSLVGAFAFFRLFTTWFTHGDAPVSDGFLLAVTLALVGYLWLCQSGTLHELGIAQAQLISSQVSVIGTLVKTIEAKDPYTRGHSEEVARLSVELARTLQLPDDSIAVVNRAGVLHDIGKLGIADDILHKDGPLSDAEWQVMKDHVRRASDILSTLSFLERESRIALLHHERYDGRGYGLGLKADEIPIEAYIIAIADGFDAMNAERPYRGRIPRAQVISEITKGRATQYHPRVADAFLTLLDDRPELWARSK